MAKKSPGFSRKWVQLATQNAAMILPFFLSGLVFISGLFTVFAPVPLLGLGVQRKARWAVTAFFTNMVLVWILRGLASGLSFFVLVGPIALAMPFFTRRLAWSPNRVVAATLSVALGATLVVLAAMAFSPQFSIRELLGREINSAVEMMREAMKDLGDGQISQISAEQLRAMVLEQFPAGFAILLLVMTVGNYVFYLRMLPASLLAKMGISPAFFKEWSAPDWAIWPTIAFGAVVIFEPAQIPKWGLIVSSNLLFFFLAIFALQGIAVANALFTHFKLRPWFRALLFVVLILFVRPLIVAIGLFDQWFDFRSKFRQT